ncbi:myb family transcription factor EFM [Papaver somniferum]|uniref:myb family transcription factor EFM n=1 Tax=Papaver somniferum TaxID=3469 RepID=UPI000E6F48CE|nr:myb family transcription factor EFM [Papaver somniferum]
MSSSSELNQAEIKPQSYSLLLKSFGDYQIQQNHIHQPGQTQKLEEFLAHLEEEWLKIEAFKRELPLCMQLLANAMEASRQQLQTCRTPNQDEAARPVLEEFIPLKHSNTEGSEKASNISEKSSWMISAQLWSNSNEGITKQQQQLSKDETDRISSEPKLALEDKKRNAGAFLPFSKEAADTCSSPTLRVLPDLALNSTSTDKEIIDEKKCIESENNRISCRRRDNNNSGIINVKGGDGGNSMTEQGKVVAASQGDAQGNSNSTQAHRKARRCWSPDLHRRFVNALQMLGGSQVATPKQIRELMKVDGLTNDEVKSHLQKYRLHTRRPSPSPQSAGNPTPQLVVLGSIWVPPEYAAAAAAAHNNGGGGPTIYSTHPASLTSTHYCATPTQVAVPQEYYTTQQPSHHLLHHNNLQLHHHHPHHIYKLSPSSKTPLSSPESDGNNTVSRGGGGGDQSESIEDGKSESSNWKGDSGGGGGGDHHNNTSEDEQRRGLASLRDESDKSNGTSDEHQITLKF